MPNPSVRGQFIWHELMTSDPQAASGFYKKVVGWKTQSWEKDSSYSMFVGGAGPVAGFMELPDHVKAMGVPPNWLTYIGTPDVDATARQAEELGGGVLRQPEDIPGTGRFAVLRDPQGAVFAAYTPGTDSPERDQQVLGEFSWHELATSDLDGAWRFYSELFGWHKTSGMDMGPGLGVYQMFGHGALVLGGMYRKPDNMPAPPNWLPYALVPDSKSAAAKLKSLGGAVLNGPMEVPGGDWIVVGRDPQGAAFAVHSKVKAAKAATPVKKAAPKKATPMKKAVKKKATPKKKAVKKAAPKKKAVRKGARKAAPKKSGARKRKKVARKVARRPARKAVRRPAKRRGARKKK